MPYFLTGNTLKQECEETRNVVANGGTDENLQSPPNWPPGGTGGTEQPLELSADGVFCSPHRRRVYDLEDITQLNLLAYTLTGEDEEPHTYSM